MIGIFSSIDICESARTLVIENDAVKTYQISAGTYFTIEQLLAELQYRLSPDGYSVGLYLDDVAKYGAARVSISHDNEFTLDCSESLLGEMLGYERKCYQSSKEVLSQTDPYHSLILQGVTGNDKACCKRICAQCIDAGGSLHVRQLARAVYRNIQMSALSDRQVEVLRDIWDECFMPAKGYCRYINDYSPDLDGGSWQRLERLVPVDGSELEFVRSFNDKGIRRWDCALEMLRLG